MRVLLPIYLDLLVGSERALAYSFRTVAYGHSGDADVHYLAESFAVECDKQVDRLIPLASRFEGDEARHEVGPERQPERLHTQPLTLARTGPLGLLRDLQDLYTLADLVVLTCSLVRQAGLGLDDSQLIEVARGCRERTQAQLDWLRTRLNQAAPQALIVG